MAIKEFRQIVLDAEELRASLQQTGRIGQLGLALDQPFALEFCVPDDCIEVRQDIGSPVKLSGAMLAVLIMKWCGTKKIPLPKSGNKSVRVTDDSVILSISVDPVLQEPERLISDLVAQLKVANQRIADFENHVVTAQAPETAS
jgi:hypothetical protein